MLGWINNKEKSLITLTSDRAEDAKQKELIHGLKVENVDLNLKIAELEREMVFYCKTTDAFGVTP
jgi:hypothetical protein